MQWAQQHQPRRSNTRRNEEREDGRRFEFRGSQQAFANDSDRSKRYWLSGRPSGRLKHIRTGRVTQAFVIIRAALQNVTCIYIFCPKLFCWWFVFGAWGCFAGVVFLGCFSVVWKFEKKRPVLPFTREVF